MRKFDVILKAFALQDKFMQLRAKSRDMVLDRNVSEEDHQACCDAVSAAHRELLALSYDLPMQYFLDLMSERHAQ